jgi:hypothetical protein
MKTQLIEKLVEQLLNEKEPKWNGDDLPFIVGKAYLIRTVTYHMLGVLERVSGAFLVLKEASWVADSGKFSTAIAKGELSEIEYVGDAIVSMNAIVDAFPWIAKVPRETK